MEKKEQMNLYGKNETERRAKEMEKTDRADKDGVQHDINHGKAATVF